MFVCLFVLGFCCCWVCFFWGGGLFCFLGGFARTNNMCISPVAVSLLVLCLHVSLHLRRGLLCPTFYFCFSFLFMFCGLFHFILLLSQRHVQIDRQREREIEIRGEKQNKTKTTKHEDGTCRCQQLLFGSCILQHALIMGVRYVQYFESCINYEGRIHTIL